MRSRSKDLGTKMETRVVDACQAAGLIAERIAEGGSKDLGDVRLFADEEWILECKDQMALNVPRALEKALQKEPEYRFGVSKDGPQGRKQEPDPGWPCRRRLDARQVPRVGPWGCVMNERETMSDELNKHLDRMARWGVRLAFEAWLENDPWEVSFPDVGMHDYSRIIDRAEGLLPSDVTLAEFKESYEYLRERAEVLA